MCRGGGGGGGGGVGDVPGPNTGGNDGLECMCVQRRCGGSLRFLKSELLLGVLWQWEWSMYLIHVDGGIYDCWRCVDTSWSLQF